MHLVDLELRLGHDLAHGDAVDDGGDCDLAFAVLAFDGGGRPALHHLAELLDADAGAGGGVYDDVLYVFDALSALGFVHDLDVVLLAVLAVLGGEGAVDAVAHGGGDGGHVKSVEGELLAVEIDLNLGLVVGAGDGDVGGAGDAFQDLHELGGDGVGLGEVVAVDFEVHGGLAAHALSATAADVDLGLLELGEVAVYVLAHAVGDLLDAALAVAGIVQADVHRGDVGAIVAE